MKDDDFSVVFDGVADIDDCGDMVILADLDELIAAGFDKETAEDLAKAKGSCRSKRNKGTIDCLKGTCNGVCHVFSAPKGPGPHTETDEGVGPITMSKNRFYWCRCV